MAYTPPVGTADLSIGSVLGYTPPVGTANLSIGHSDSLDRQAWIDGTTAAPTGAIHLRKQRMVSIAGTTAAPTGHIQIGKLVLGVIAGTTASPTGRLRSHYDPNLLSAVHVCSSQLWQEGEATSKSELDRFQHASLFIPGADCRWQEADPARSSDAITWQPAASSMIGVPNAWQDGIGRLDGKRDGWTQTQLAIRQAVERFQEADSVLFGATSLFRVGGNFLALVGLPSWQNGRLENHSLLSRAGDSLLLVVGDIEVWQPGGYPGNAPNPGPPLPPPPLPWPWGTNLHLRCALPGTTLRIGRSPCIIFAEREIPIRRDYVSVNSASLTLLPNRTPLPCTSMTISTDLKSWCWGLTASLNGAGAFELVQPTPAGYPVEVEATINGWTWTFMLDYPTLDRAFNKHNLNIQGRSRSAWLSSPWTPKTMGFQANARTAQQLAEEALENTGWTLDWQLDDWLVPARRFEWDNDRIGRIVRLLNPVAGKLYTHPTLQILKAYPPYPVASWLLAGETADIELPSNIVATLRRTPNLTTAYNGVYVSGTSDGVLALVKIAGTDGMIQPGQPIVEALCCDENGVAARMRGLAFLSENAGCGYSLDLQTLLGYYGNLGNLPSLLIPNTLVLYESMKGLVRSVSINAAHSGGWTGTLQVRQNLEVEFWEIEE